MADPKLTLHKTTQWQTLKYTNSRPYVLDLRSAKSPCRNRLNVYISIFGEGLKHPYKTSELHIFVCTVYSENTQVYVYAKFEEKL